MPFAHLTLYNITRYRYFWCVCFDASGGPWPALGDLDERGLEKLVDGHPFHKDGAEYVFREARFYERLYLPSERWLGFEFLFRTAHKNGEEMDPSNY